MIAHTNPVFSTSDGAGGGERNGNPHGGPAAPAPAPALSSSSSPGSRTPAAGPSNALIRSARFLHPLREFLFSLDIYGFLPNVVSAEFKTWMSLLVSLLVQGAFLVCVGYTTYNWCTTLSTVSESVTIHNESVWLVPEAAAVEELMHLPLPPFGVTMTLGSGQLVSWDDQTDLRLVFQQSIICHGDIRTKQQWPVVTAPCSFAASTTSTDNVTRCASWEEPVTGVVNNSNPCGLDTDGTTAPLPRIVGSFFGPEYSYVTATVQAKASALAQPASAKLIYGGTMQVFINYDFTSAGSLVTGEAQTSLGLTWGTRINLLPGYSSKCEVDMVFRKIKVDSYWWNVDSLARDVAGYSPAVATDNYLSTPSVTGTQNWTDVGKVYLHWGIQDSKVEFLPPGDFLALLASWGGFLAILTAIGVPIAILNQCIFQRRVKGIIEEGSITFDEDLRKQKKVLLHERSRHYRASVGGAMEAMEEGQGHCSEGSGGSAGCQAAQPAARPRTASGGGHGPACASGQSFPGAAAGVHHDVPSVTVDYHGDEFADLCEEDGLEDVMRHATSECNALLHLRQVVKLVQARSPGLTLWAEDLEIAMAIVAEKQRSKVQE